MGRIGADIHLLEIIQIAIGTAGPFSGFRPIPADSETETASRRPSLRPGRALVLRIEALAGLARPEVLTKLQAVHRAGLER